MTAILGINSFHADSAACLLLDGKLVGAVAEERLGERQKHTSRFPANAIRWLLKSNGISLADITHVAIPRKSSANLQAKAAWILKNPDRGLRAASEHFRRSGKTTSFVEQLASICGENSQSVKFETVYVEHHKAHVASSYYCSPFESLTAGFSYDASGDFASAMATRCEGSKIEVLDRVTLPHSLGFFYTALCQFIGFDEFGEEYKVMGLAPYGTPAFEREMKELVQLPEKGWFKLDTRYFGMHEGGESGGVDEAGHLVMGRLYSDKLIDLLGDPAQRGTITQREMDIAHSVQKRFEEAAVHCVNRLHSIVPTNQLAMAGGCALNGVANSRILRETPFEVPYLQAASSDDGTCIGAAFSVWHETLGMGERFHMQHAFWGPEHSEGQMLEAAQNTGLPIKQCKSPEHAAEHIAKLIADGYVVGWYQGRCEWGPRALGNRSILANPADPDIKDTINAKIKRRESFRPFAPSVLQEDVATYFEQDVYSPFMMHVVKLKQEFREKLPGITHVDGTGRLQSVDPASNALYHHLITCLKKHTGYGLVLNTSFNENEPVVDTPAQAVDCFVRTDMDALCLGRYVIEKV